MTAHQRAEAARRQFTGVIAALVILSLVVLFGLALLGPIARWLTAMGGISHLSALQQLQAIDEVRGKLLQLVAGVAAVGALIYNARNHQVSKRTYELAERGQVTDRFTKAVEQLASNAVEVRHQRKASSMLW